MTFFRSLLLRSLAARRPNPLPLLAHHPRHFAFSSAEEAAAERRRRKRRLRIEPPLHALRRDPSHPSGSSSRPPGPPLPDSTSRLVGPRLTLHNRVQSLIRSGDLDGASAVARHSVYSSVRPTVFTCNAIVAAMHRADPPRPDDTVALFQFFFRQSGIIPNVVSYNICIYALCSVGRVDEALALYKEILEKAPFSPSSITFRHLTKGLIDVGRIQDAYDLLREMLHKGLGADSLVYNNLIGGYIDLGNWDKAFELFDELRERCLVYDGVVHTTFMEAYWKQGKDKEAMASYQSLLDRQFKMPPATCNVLLETLFKHEKYAEANKLWESMLDNHIPPTFIAVNAESYNVMVKQRCKEGKYMEAIEVFHTEPRKPVQFDVGCYNTIIGKLCENGLLEEAEKIFEEMSTKSVLPDVYTYTYLADACFRSGRTDDALNYFSKMADSGDHSPRFNVAFFNKMFDGLTKADRVDDALTVYGRMGEKEIKPNVQTYEILVMKLLEVGNLDKARDLVQEMVRYHVSIPSEFRTKVADTFKEAGRGEEIESVFSPPRPPVGARQSGGQAGSYGRPWNQDSSGSGSQAPPPPHQKQSWYQPPNNQTRHPPSFAPRNVSGELPPQSQNSQQNQQWDSFSQAQPGNYTPPQSQPWIPPQQSQQGSYAPPLPRHNNSWTGSYSAQPAYNTPPLAQPNSGPVPEKCWTGNSYPQVAQSELHSPQMANSGFHPQGQVWNQPSHFQPANNAPRNDRREFGATQTEHSNGPSISRDGVAPPTSTFGVPQYESNGELPPDQAYLQNHGGMQFPRR